MKNIIVNLRLLYLFASASLTRILLNKNTPFGSQTLRFGVLLILLSSAVFIGTIHTVPDDGKMALFIVNYSFFVLYAIITLMKRKDKTIDRKIKISMLYYCAALGFISCFALNQSMQIFRGSTVWLDVCIVSFIILCVLRPFIDNFHSIVRFTYYVFMGLGLLLMNYYTVCLTATFPIGLVGIIFFGLGLHAFIPLLISILIILEVVFNDRPAQKGLGFGYLLACSLLGLSLWLVANRINDINKLCNGDAMNSNGSLPVWIKVAQQLDDDYLNFHILKTEDVSWNSWGIRSLSRSNRDEKETHDPLVVMAGYFSPKLSLSVDDKIKVLETLSNNSNVTESRLWAGEDLKTTFVGTNIVIHEAERIAYTEKLLTIKNTKQWGTQEAVFTFQLPEGGVVTGLSLWINGKEEKAVLTSKEKAKNAYNNIVGYQRRDPSMVLWKEGDRVSVRVFPCTYQEERRVKLGIAAPLKLRDNTLYYEPIGIVGTDLSLCQERIQVKGDEAKVPLKLPNGFKKEGNIWVREGLLDTDFCFTTSCKPLVTRSFSHDGYTYTLKPYVKTYTPKVYKSIYLDLNRTWSKEEIQKVLAMNMDKEVYYCDLNQELIPISNTNLEEVYDFAQKNIYSLFPFYVIDKPATALVVTKTGKQSPDLKALLASEFGDQLKNKILKYQYDIFNIGSVNSLYLSSLKQFERLNMDFGDINILEDLTRSQKFKTSTYNQDNVAVFQQNGTLIERSTTLAPATGSDFLTRLFVYQKNTAAYFPVFFNADTSANTLDALVLQGQIANVVTPTTSLIVLETQQDYETFDVKNQTNTLGNSSIFKKQDAGAAPEPHEWVMIIICSLVAVYVYKDQILKSYFLYFSRKTKHNI